MHLACARFSCEHCYRARTRFDCGIAPRQPAGKPMKVVAGTRRAIGVAFFAVMVAAPGVRDAAAQKWPDKPVRIVTPFAPGGGTDVFARLLAQRFSEVFGQQFIVDN